MQQPGKDELGKLIGRAVDKLQDKADKEEVKHLVVKFLMKKHQLDRKQAKALCKEALKPGRGWQVLDGKLVREHGPADSVAAPSEQAANTSLQEQHLEQQQQQQQRQKRTTAQVEEQLQAPAAKSSKKHALASAGAAARSAGASRPPAASAAEVQVTSSGAGSQGSLQPASTVAGPPPPAVLPAAAVAAGTAAGGKAASKAAVSGAAAGRSRTQAALAAAMLAAPAGSAAGQSTTGGQRQQQQQQQGRKRKVPEPTGSLQASAGTAFRPAVFSLQAGIPQGGNQSGGDDSSGEEDAPKKKRSRRGAGAAPRRPDGETWRGDYNRSDVTHGRFTEAEKEALRAAIVAYEEEHDMDTDDHTWLLAATANRRKGAVSQIAGALPHRNRKAVWSCLVRMLSPDNYKGPWTQAEDQQLKELVEDKGQRWKEIGGLLGRLPESCRDRWRIRWQVPDVNTGPWSQEELSKLRQVVERALAMKNAGGGQRTIRSAPNRDMARERSMFELDGVNWEWVATEMGTRNYKQCLQKWYDDVAPEPTELWDKGEEKSLVRALWLTQATEPYEVDWGSLVEGRSAAEAYRRWRLLMKVIPAKIRWDLAAAVEHAMNQFGDTRKELKAARKAAKRARKQQQAAEEEEEEHLEGGEHA